jgi:hypothetical protein
MVPVDQWREIPAIFHPLKMENLIVQLDFLMKKKHKLVSRYLLPLVHVRSSVHT